MGGEAGRAPSGGLRSCACSRTGWGRHYHHHQETKAADVAKEVTKAADVAKEVTKAADVAKEVTKAADVAKEVTKAADVAEEVTKAADVAKEVTKAADVAKEVTKAADVAKEETKAADVAEEVTKAADVAKEVTKAADVAKEVTKAADVAEEVTKAAGVAEKVTKAADVAEGVTIVSSKQRSQIMDEVEKLLLILIKKELEGDSISLGIICEKALHICDDHLKETPSTSAEGESGFTFKSSRDWFEKSTHQSGIHGVVRHGETASSNKEAVEKDVGEFCDFVNAGGHLPQQVFNYEKTGLFWRKMPNRNYITKEEESKPGHKPMKGRITISVCANAGGHCKIKPMVIYHSENPRIVKRNKVMKSKLPVIWQSNPETWCTRQFFVEWVYVTFGPQVKEYLKEKQLPLRCLLVMDNATVHPHD